MKQEPMNPSLSNLTNRKFGVPPDHQNNLLQQLGKPHIDSFNFMCDEGLKAAVSNLRPVEFDFPTANGVQRVQIRIISAHLGTPTIPYGVAGIKRSTIFPSECRQRQGTYRGRLVARLSYSIDGVEGSAFDKDFGEIPIMLKSNRCHLAKMNPSELVASGEHEQEWGGYFVVKGLERLVRMLLMTRRNYPIALSRSGWKGRGPLFSDKGVLIRCVKRDETAVNNVLHYVTDGSVKVMFSYKKILYYANLVLILKCLCDYTDKHIYARLIAGSTDLHYSSAVQAMIRLIHEQDLHTHDECKAYLGRIFRVKLIHDLPPNATDPEVADFIIKHCIMIHLDRNEDKFNMFVHMTQKLHSFVMDKCKVEGVDSVMMQELLLGGHLYLMLLKERLQDWLSILRSVILKKQSSHNGMASTSIKIDHIKMGAKQAGTFESTMEAFFATGNLSSQSGLGVMQNKGLTILPENINRMRYMSHFKSVHRGAFFQEMRTTEVRQLLPDAWGFICPVHTPDGAPCGLLNHLTLDCIVTQTADPAKLKNLEESLIQMGVAPLDDEISDLCYNVILDGKLLGKLAASKTAKTINTLRIMKIKGARIPNQTEIVWVPRKESVGQYPGVFIFTGPTRMMRPLMNLKVGEIEFVGTFEQVYMEVAVRMSEVHPTCTTHVELSLTGFMSNLAHLIPMPDCNQSPRNMYQCQMGKQTMGTPTHMWNLQAENKLYRLQTPASPLFRPVHHDRILMDDFAMGTNAIVAVISYTGYDMEDAMIINQSSYERGFAHGSIYKSEFIELGSAGWYFCRDPQRDLAEYLDPDGLPYIGRQIKNGEPLYCYFDTDRNQYCIGKASAKEECYVDNVRLCGDFGGLKKAGRKICLTYRLTRNPTIGDKFASRAGQKGICSQRWPSIDLPFTESGLVPDVIFNPHGFPSRMTIAMMIEIMAGKSSALHGLVHDATPFRFNEDDTAIDYFGRLLEAAGYDYYGTEVMYSGIDGREMNARIFFGIVHYQRLRHMVSDKFQVRSTGTTDIVTRQPIKGRKRGGGVRFGEMERDGLISHGSAFLLQDRMLHCTDKSVTQMCQKCCSLVGLVSVVKNKSDKPQHSERRDECQLCQSSEHVIDIQLPYIYRFFATQMAACNVFVKFTSKHV